ncbi:MAG: peptide-methionine (S)-S-oxide reductase MsrA [Candidatus Omnitrophica bacterium]|nr:peptide-methionine (S)-S-oxide reductase MsrA [Candidatus Omnitrophota bacterium]
MAERTHTATFAAGCFWGVEKIFSGVPGVTSTAVGYAGGKTVSPSYSEVCAGNTGHAEAIEITYDQDKVTYADLLRVFYSHHDPTTPDRQGPDVGSQYRSAIFYHTDEQRALAEKSRELLNASGALRRPVVTQIAPAGAFYRAEDYHQKYLEKNPQGYCSIQTQPGKVLKALENL